MSPRLRGSLIALAGTSAWAFTGIFISLLLKRHTIEPLVLAFWRDLIIALALLGILLAARPAALRITRRDLPFFLIYGFLGLAVFNGLWTFSVRYNGAAVATVLAYSSPAFTVLLARMVLREPLAARKWLAVALSLAGCVLVADAYHAQAWRLNPVGIVIGLGTGLAFAGYSLAGRWSAGRFASAWTVTAYGFLCAAGGLLLMQAVFGLRAPAPYLGLFSLGTAWEGWLLLIFLAVGPSLAGFGLYTRSLRDLPAGTAGLIAALEPVLTALIAIPVLNEHLDIVQWIGAGLILAAVVLAQSESPAQQPAVAQAASDAGD